MPGPPDATDFVSAAAVRLLLNTGGAGCGAFAAAASRANNAAAPPTPAAATDVALLAAVGVGAAETLPLDLLCRISCWISATVGTSTFESMAFFKKKGNTPLNTSVPWLALKAFSRALLISLSVN